MVAFLFIYLAAIAFTTALAENAADRGGVSLRKTTTLNVNEQLDTRVDSLVYRPQTTHNYYYQRNGQPVLYYQQQSTYYQPQQYYYPAYGYGGGGGGGYGIGGFSSGGIFGLCIVCFGIGKR